jgi:hypothetical protein
MPSISEINAVIGCLPRELQWLKWSRLCNEVDVESYWDRDLLDLTIMSLSGP